MGAYRRFSRAFGKSRISSTTACLLPVFFGFILPLTVSADGGEEGLGAPGVFVASGTGIVASGIGLAAQPNTILLDVPGVSVAQAFLYWTGEGLETGDDTIEIGKDGARIARTGIVIGGPEFVFSIGNEPIYMTTYRADVTDLINPGPNTMSLSGLNFGPTKGPDGAGLLVIYDDGETNIIDIRDGQDFAFLFFDPPLDAAVPQLFSYDPMQQPRQGQLTIFAASVGANRPNIIRYTLDGNPPVDLINALSSNNGKAWDTFELSLTIPAGSASLTLEVISFDDETEILPASLTFVMSALTINPSEPFCGDGTLDDGEECDDGNNVDGDGCSANCTIEPFCGDGMIGPGEECDGNNDAACPGGCNPNCECAPRVPTVSSWGLIVLALLIVIVGKLGAGQRSSVR